MRRIVFTAFVLLWVGASSLAAASDHVAIAALQAETEALFKPDRDLADVKLSIDHMVDSTVNVQAGLAAVDRMAEEVQAMADGATGSAERLAALKRYVYETGPWNGEKPFQYDLADPLGENPVSRKLIRYLETRRGNCVTMPILFLLLGERLGLQVTLVEAPLHLFVKYTDDDGKAWNLEATIPPDLRARADAWYRENTTAFERAEALGWRLQDGQTQ